eukprot:2415895-Pyramimonas_sp.AAC.1
MVDADFSGLICEGTATPLPASATASAASASVGGILTAQHIAELQKTNIMQPIRVSQSGPSQALYQRGAAWGPTQMWSNPDSQQQ